ncbi:MAG: hypothetical protein LBU82_01415 [Treponema sp.]|jgi:hypothetical protein|nr:hypothetical protein [Treponema sp.]
MKNKKVLLGVLVIPLVLGMAACKEEAEDSTSIVGTWANADAGITLKFNSDNSYEIQMGGAPLIKGTYITSGSSLTITPTGINGGNPFLSGAGLENKWYTEAELRQAAKAGGMTDAEIDEWMGEMQFVSSTFSYSISGNTLSLTITVDGETDTLTFTKA